jgi:hypothetical protein
MPPRSAPAQNAPRSPSPTVAVVVAVIAAALGFFILKQVSDDEGGGSATPGTDASTETTVPASTATTTAPTVDKASFQVVVANASGVGGAAGKMTTDLQARGYKTLKATNVAPGTPQAATTTVYYTAGSQAAANAVLAELGLAGPAQPIPATGFVVPDADRAGANVVVVLGKDLAGKALPSQAATATTAPGTVTLPAGGTSPNATTTTAG